MTKAAALLTMVLGLVLAPAASAAAPAPDGFRLAPERTARDVLEWFWVPYTAAPNPGGMWAQLRRAEAAALAWEGPAGHYVFHATGLAPCTAYEARVRATTSAG